MQVSVVDLLVPTEIEVENISETVSKVTLEPVSYTHLTLPTTGAV